MSKIYVLVCFREGETYVFSFNDDTRTELLRTLGRMAADPELSFSWYDAAILSQKARNTVCQSVPSESAELKSDFDCRGI